MEGQAGKGPCFSLSDPNCGGAMPIRLRPELPSMISGGLHLRTAAGFSRAYPPCYPEGALAWVASGWSPGVRPGANPV